MTADTGEMSIQHAAVDDDGTRLHLRLTLRNAGGSTVHAYNTVRAILYDPATRHLTVRLTDTGVERPAIPMWDIPPRLVAVDPGDTREVTVDLPRFVTRLVAAPEGGPPHVEQLPAHEAEAVEVEVGWSDKPFYSDPRGKYALHEQLRRWELGIAHAETRRGGQPPPAPRERRRG
jgi:hypothetical protein